MTIYIIGFTCLVSLMALGNAQVMQQLWFEPFVIKARGEWYRFFTHAFVHANYAHLFVNMFVLYMFGTIVEQNYAVILHGHGLTAYIVLYLGGIFFGAIPGYKKHIYDPNYRAVGASGATAAVLFAHILMLPTAGISYFFLPGIPAWLFGLLYIAFEWYQGKRGGTGIAHDAHIYGALFGVGFTAILDTELITNFGYLQP